MMTRKWMLAPMWGATFTVSALLMTAIAAWLVIQTGSPYISAQSQAADAAVEISIDNFAFAPAELTIPAGTVVKWINHDDIPHLVAEKSLAFRSKALDTGDTFTHQFNDVGETDYFCTLHPHMTGKIIVRPKGH